ncbi:porin [Pandoraea terrae]
MLVAALAGTFPIAAQAQQSSVTMYGLIDASISYVANNGGSANWQQTSGLVNGSRWGLRGNEDLGRGTQAIFTLENGFSIGNGKSSQGNRMFGRQAFVGLSTASAGTLTFGRQYDTLVDHLAPLALIGGSYGGAVATHPYDNDNLGNSIRFDNAVKYSSVNYGGFSFGAMYGFPSKRDNYTKLNRAFSVAASYANGPLRIAGGYLEMSGGTMFSPTNRRWVVTGLPFTAGKQRRFGLGASYAMGPATVGAVWTQSRFPNMIAMDLTGQRRIRAVTDLNFNNYELNVHYLLTPAVSLSGSYTYTRARKRNSGGGNIASHRHTVTLQIAHSMSRRTDVYLTSSYRHVTRTQHAALGGLFKESGVLAASAQTVIATGIRHRF